MQLQALLKDDGSIVKGKTISFSNSGPGVLSPDSKLTDDDGIAAIQISAGDSSGAGTITANVSGSGAISVEIDYGVEVDGTTGGAIPVMTLSLLNGSGSVDNVVRTDAPLQVMATVSLEGTPVIGKVVSFTVDNFGVLDRPSKLTDANGSAVIELQAGSAAGAGTLTATYIYGDSSTLTQQATFDVVLVDVTPELSLVLEDINGDSLDTVAQATPGKLKATLMMQGQPISNALVQFSTSPVGVINPSLGTAVTDASGVAEVTLLPGDQAGASTATASFVFNNVSYQQDVVFQTAGDAPEQAGGQDNLIEITLLDGVGGSPITNSTISETQPGYFEVQVRNSQQQPLAGKVVSFTSTLGNFIPATGTALTDSNGVATIVLQAGSVEGAGEVVANVGGATSTIGFITLGDVIDPGTLVPEITFEIYNCNNASGWDRATRNFEACTVTDNITNTESGIIGMQVTQAGSSQPLTQTLVLASTTLGGISPSAGTAVTDDNGRAILDLFANGDVGAGEVTVSVSGQSASKAFEIGRVDVNLQVSAQIGSNNLPAGGSTIIEVQVQNPDGSLALDQPFAIELSSDCIVAGTAVVDTPVNTIGGIAYATYRANGCNGTDRVTASAQTGGTNVTGDVSIDVTGAKVGSIQYVSAVPSLLALKSSGGIGGTGSRSETGVVTFKLLDETAAAATQELLCFELATDVGGIELTPSPVGDDIASCSNIPAGADLTKYASGYTDAEGMVSVTVKAGSVPTPVKVFALWSDGTNNISNVSDELVISTGLADNNSFSMSASVFNPEGLQFDGEVSSINILAADHFNNPVPDGTTVSFVTEGGAVDPTCTTINGACSVEWRSQDPRPFDGVGAVCSVADNLGSTAPPCIDPTVGPSRLDFNGSGFDDKALPGRATVMAYAIGEESFIDLNGNGQFDAGEPFGDLSEAFRDDNEDGVYRNFDATGANPSGAVPAGAVTEEFTDFDLSDDFTAADGLYTGLLCDAASSAACSDTGLDDNYAHLNVSRNLAIVMAGSSPQGKLAFSDAPYAILNGAQINLITDASRTVVLYLTDVNNNPLPVGTSITAATSNGVLVIGESYAFPNTSADRPSAYVFTVEQETEPNGKTEGTLTITVKTPKGAARTYGMPVLDAG
ncbi:invasin [uncultured Ferrimonas sp.]|uniref:invasin n=1 Tax=uncultured Ferrimonas sp. TaxID=432640 RepID=UPI0026150B68|nr:invasin [uncultured Ferrimonas sp.]